MTLFAELTDCAAVWKSGREGWDMRESTIVAEWRAEGIAEGKAEGRAEGRAETRARIKLTGTTRDFMITPSQTTIHFAVRRVARLSAHGSAKEQERRRSE